MDVDPLLRESLADPGAVAVLVVDMQADFCANDGAMAVLGADTSRNGALVGPIDAFLSQIRQARCRVVWVRQEASEAHASPARRRRASRMGRTATSVCAAGTPGARLADGLTVEPEDLAVTKYRYSAFIGTDLDLLLRSQGVTTVVVVGTAANVCVDSTARDAYQRDYDTIVVRDLVGWTLQALAEAALENLDAYFATVTGSQEVLAALPSSTP